MGSWIGKKVFNANTMQYGIVVDAWNNYTHSLEMEFEDDTKEIISMNNICSSRESEIANQEKYKHIFWLMGIHAEKDYGFQPFASDGFLKDPEAFKKICEKVTKFTGNKN